MADLLVGAAFLAFFWASAVGLLRLFAPGAGRYAALGGRLSRRRQAAVGAAALCWGLVLLAFLWAAAKAQEPGAPALQTIRYRFCGGLDARHYFDLARWGYGAGEADFAEQYLMIVFFPLWPLLLRPFALLGCDLWLAGTGLSLALTAAGTVFLYRCAVRVLCSAGGRRTDTPALFACAVQLAMPGSFFFALPQTEALFFCLSFAFLDAMQRRRYGLAGLLGMLAALCRANGALLAGYAVLQLWLQWRAGAGSRRPRPAWALPVLGPAVGVGGYLALNWAVYENAFQFTVYQKQHWHHSFCLFTKALRTMYGEAASADSSRAVYLGLWTAVLILIEAVLLALAARRLPPHWLLLGLAGFVLMNGQTWLISAQRYALGMPALPLAAAAVCFGQRPGRGKAAPRRKTRRPRSAPAAAAGAGSMPGGSAGQVPHRLGRAVAAAAVLCVLLALGGAYFAGFVGGAPIY